MYGNICIHATPLLLIAYIFQLLVSIGCFSLSNIEDSIKESYETEAVYVGYFNCQPNLIQYTKSCIFVAYVCIMRTISLFFLGLFLVVGCQKKEPILGETEFQRELNAEFKDASKSPLKKKDRNNFKGLDFFKFDSSYVVQAAIKRTPDEQPFKMKTTTDRLPEYVKYGELTFNLENETFQLNVFRNLDLAKEEGYEDYLFLPFLDDTNGDETYGGGRYIDLRIPEGDVLAIDFNTAYNPYCAYNEKYSCPIVPRDNYVGVEIKAGVKAFVVE